MGKKNDPVNLSEDEYNFTLCGPSWSVKDASTVKKLVELICVKSVIGVMQEPKVTNSKIKYIGNLIFIEAKLRNGMLFWFLELPQ